MGFQYFKTYCYPNSLDYLNKKNVNLRIISRKGEEKFKILESVEHTI